MNNGYKLNIMLPMSAFGEGGYVSKYFDELILDREEMGKSYVDLVLVFLEKPTTEAKKKLRINIEKYPKFKGK